MDLIGLHHITAITADVKKNHRFYTEILGMRLVKKTVNQDDTTEYHLFYADEIGRPGTGLTFFETSDTRRFSSGLSSISNISLRVPNDKALEYWHERFKKLNVDNEGITKQLKRKVIHFRDPEGQRLTFVSDEKNTGVAGGTPWKKSSVPAKHGIVGIGSTLLTVRNPVPTISILTKLLTFKQVDSYPSLIQDQKDILVFSTGEGGTGAEIHVESRNDLPQEVLGAGGVHHLALRVKDEEQLRSWKDHLENARMPNSGLVDRFYFKSLYFRDPNGIMFELATDEPGFTIDEEEEFLGETLSLPTSLKSKRSKIEDKLIPFDTKRPH